MSLLGELCGLPVARVGERRSFKPCACPSADRLLRARPAGSAKLDACLSCGARRSCSIGPKHRKTETAPATTTLGDWYATVLSGRPRVALFVNEPTRLPVLVPLAPAKPLVGRFVADLGTVFAYLGLDPRFIDAELAELTAYRWGKTTNRSVVGTWPNSASSLGITAKPNATSMSWP